MTSQLKELIDECNALAHTLYECHGYKAADGFKFYEATHPQEKLMWIMACAAYDHISGTDIEDVLNELLDEDDAE